MTKLKKTDQELKGLKGEVGELSKRYQRALADYQNLEKRVGLEKEEFAKFANAQLILKILPGLDSLEKASQHLKDEGLKLALKQLTDELASSGLEKIQTFGQDFDPETMECLEIAQGEEGKVLDEIRPGYKLNNRVLRVAQVRVGQVKGENNE
jgi:molecular chaperone GrpE